MGSKVFRIYKGGNETLQDWQSATAFPYNETHRSQKNMVDPGGNKPSNEITSIPSPFARIDLVKNAFREICQACNTDGGYVDYSALDGSTIFHKMVSDTLDVAEIFFRYGKLSDRIEIIPWNPAVAIEELQKSGVAGHYNYAQVLDTFLNAPTDKATYNFDVNENFYLLNYRGGQQQLNIIGATSPSTIFFSNANNLKYVGQNIVFGQDKPFDDDYRPLYRRDPEFICSLFLLRKVNPLFPTLYAEVNDYLDLTFGALSDINLKDRIQKLTIANAADYSPIIVNYQNQAHEVAINGMKLYMQRQQTIANSDFMICPTVSFDGLLPLVLPVESGSLYKDFHYVCDKWGSQYHAPYRSSEHDYNMRTLPFDGSRHPYLTIDDFLEEMMIAVPHGINSYLFDGNMDCSINPSVKRKTAYLIPVKELFFKFFSIDDLKGNLPSGFTSEPKKMFEMMYLASGAVKVILRIPVKGCGSMNYIEYTRKYYPDRQSKIDQTHNEGGIFNESVFKELDLLIMPCVKFSNLQDAMYRVFAIHDKNDNFALDFYSDGTLVTDIPKECRNTNGEYQLSTDVYVLENVLFDSIRLRYGKSQGLIVPLFKQNTQTQSFQFSVDLGTTNTHVEFKKLNVAGESHPLSFSVDDEMVANLFLPRTEIIGNVEMEVEFMRQNNVVERDLFPSEFNDSSDFHFPTRTQMFVAKTIDWRNTVYPFGLANIAFAYCKRSILQYNKELEESVKWGNSENSNRIATSYIDNLMFILRNKVVLNDGNLSSTRLTWFYPSSMPRRRYNTFNQAWQNSFRKYFGQGAILNSMTESQAPVRYFFNKYSSATDMITVDIGGGTTDIAFAKNKEIELVTSFRFAANTIFEDPFSALNTQNGIVDFYKNKIHSNIASAGRELEIIFSELENKPADMASFLFSLKDNKLIKSSGIATSEVDFLLKLQADDEFRIVFILFYSAIIYHIAQIIKAQDFPLPRHIAFSGNGSKILRAITPNPEDLASYTKRMLEKLLGRSYDKKLEIIGLENSSNPKESTCKGGMFANGSEGLGQLIRVLKGSDGSFVQQNDTYDSITTDYLQRVKSNVDNFFRFVLFDMDSDFNLNEIFGVSQQSMAQAKDIAGDKHSDVMTYLERGRESRMREATGTDTIDETFFFYPIKGLLNDIINAIYERLK